jgi:hypothetical protein
MRLAIVRRASLLAAAVGIFTAACSAGDLSADANDSSRGADPAGADAAAPNGNPNDPGAGVPAPRVGIMGEAEISEYYTRLFQLTDDNDVLNQVSYVPVGQPGENHYEHQSFFYDQRYYSRYVYENMMPATRSLVSFSQIQAVGFFALGSHFCVGLFNRPFAQATRKALFGVDDYGYDADVPTTEADRVIGILFDRVASASSVDLGPMRADVIKIMRDEFDEAVAQGTRPRDALEESCSVLMGSVVPYVL